jgi:UDP-N-acetylglucosamine 2-epimerase (non-hydrolysing)/GDP/UDP-N,N'-diacetylbacillosamine 2-epimerase (hydrolysing)
MPETDYLSLMRASVAMVGNSSSGIREAPTFRVPAINVGTRQSGRLRAANVIDVSNERGAIAAAIHRVLHDSQFRRQLATVTNPYGDGGAAKRIVDVLERVELGPRLIQKRIRY